MSRLLFQGVTGMPDISESLRSAEKACPPERNASAVTAGPALREIAFEPEPEDPKLREECGVVAIHGHPDAARQAYLSLYALQHRGQESAGIATADGTHLSNIKGMGLVSEIFTDDAFARLKATMAIGHTRYSQTGAP